MPSSRDNVYPVLVKLSAEVEKVIRKSAESQGVEFHEFLNKLATQMISLAAAGTIMVSKRRLERLAKLGGVDIDSEADIIALLEKLFARNEENIIATFEIDAAWEAHLKETAEGVGKTVHQFVADAFTAFLRDNLFSLTPEKGSPILFSAEQLEQIRRLTGRPMVSANDIMALMPKPKKKEAA